MSLNIKQKPNAIIFDWDNTLADSWPVIEKSYNQTAHEMGYPDFSMDEVKYKIGYALRHSFPKIFGDQADLAMETYRKHYYKNRENNLKLLPHASELILHLTEKEIPLFIVSNKIGTSLRDETEILKVNHYFRNIIGSLDTDHDKPHTAPVELVLENHDYSDSDEILFIGDSIVDYECAKNVGFTPIIVHADDNVKKQASDAHIYDSLAELIEII